ncbi:uncharacterized protein AMSG_04019 [Thecamonas trahens ATCC 50062]|uniref:Centromere protein H C-terminal domain-containing protein n=1 Tax=Thecamonas trahens ATCC 50062 TaxID=461836 RepID=A0A0L0D5Y0_THETB|nr:hypothetical protein AMSG_04019 [Thecamonas trahens ATCC 50062]KNC47792.1 hypothetical protein AMSG_04019 [Thecamonas trahens ATCC 50062]|eukprot:XP_013759270.1 hypothetical protein AMSG_04019 [Thecamonas trahens ATCC 50062]
MAFPAGASSTAPDTALTRDEQELILLLQVERWLAEQAGDARTVTAALESLPRELNARVSAAVDSGRSTVDALLDGLVEANAALRDDLLHATLELRRQDLLIERTHQSELARALLHPDEASNVWPQDELHASDYDRKANAAVVALIKARDQKVTELAELTAATRIYEKELAQIYMDDRTLQEHNRSLRAAVAKFSDAKIRDLARRNHSVVQAENHLEFLNRKSLIFRNVLQSLILESGVNWAANNTLRDVVLGARDPLVD